MVKSKHFKVGLFNAGSLGTKHDEFRVAIEEASPDILAINETWVREGEDAKAPSLSGYRLRHAPRPPGRFLKGGGVGFYIKRGINARVYAHPPSPPNTEQCEQMWLSLKINSKRIIIGTAYRPQWYDVNDFFDSLTDSVCSFAQFDHVILMGDFNCDLLDPSKSMRLKEFLTTTGLNNVINEPTHFTKTSATLLDVLCADTPISNAIVNYIPDLGKHAVLTGELKLQRKKIPPKCILYRPIKDIDLSLFNRHLQSLDWDPDNSGNNRQNGRWF